MTRCINLVKTRVHISAWAAVLLADAYYASHKVVAPLLKEGHHLVTRVRSNAVA